MLSTPVGESVDSSAMKHRVLIFSLAYYPHVGGAEVALKEITDRISDITFHVLTLNFGGEAKEEKIGNMFVHRIGNSASYFSKILFIPRAVFAARMLHREQHFDAFWAMMSYMVLPIVLLRARGIRVPYLLTLQEGDLWEHMFSRWFILPFRPLLSFGFTHASAVQTISTYLARWAKRMGYAGHVEVIPNGCDTALFGEDNKMRDRQFFLKHQSVDGSRTTLITTGRLVRKNAVDTVIHALVLLPTVIHFVVVGDGEERLALEGLAADLRVSDRVHFIGEIPNSQIMHYLHASDVFVRPSRAEGMGNSFIEAMAAGLPVVATQEGGIADFLFDATRNPDKETTGWAVDKDSPEQVAETVQDILTHPEQVAKVKVNALALVKEKYDWTVIVKQMRNLFATLGV